MDIWRETFPKLDLEYIKNNRVNSNGKIPSNYVTFLRVHPKVKLHDSSQFVFSEFMVEVCIEFWTGFETQVYFRWW